jgi:hypothetical protein
VLAPNASAGVTEAADQRPGRSTGGDGRSPSQREMRRSIAPNSLTKKKERTVDENIKRKGESERDLDLFVLAPNASAGVTEAADQRPGRSMGGDGRSPVSVRLKTLHKPPQTKHRSQRVTVCLALLSTGDIAVIRH